MYVILLLKIASYHCFC